MVDYRNLRKIGTPIDKIKEMIDAEQRYIAEKEPEDGVNIEQGRLDMEGYALEDSYIVNENSVSDNEGYALQDTHTELLQVSGGFQICDEEGGGAGVTQPGIVGFSDIGSEEGTS